MFRLICEPEQRLGRDDIKEIQMHPFFNNIDWSNLKNIQPLFIPQVIFLIN